MVLAATRSVAERIHPPRALYCAFPLGRPLGKPADPGFQHEVLARAFALLDAPSGPLLEDHPVEIEAEEVPMACAIPPRFDPDLPPAVDEAKGLRKAYDRAEARRGLSSVGRSIPADEVPAALHSLHRIANGETAEEVGFELGVSATGTCHDIRTYYEEAALELVDGPPPAGRAIEAWYFEETEAGKTILAARKALKDSGTSFAKWFYLTPGHR